MDASLTIGFVMREHFSCSPRTLEALYRHTRQAFNLILVDCAMPRSYRKQVDAVLQGRPGVRVIELDHFILPNAARNIVVSEAVDDYICLFENDNLVRDDWMTPLLETLTGLGSGGIVAPLMLWNNRAGNEVVHYDHSMDRIEIVDTPQGRVPRVSKKNGFQRSTELSMALRVNSTEAHVFSGSRDSLLRLLPFDEKLSTRECFDLTLSIHEAGLPIFLEPRSRANYLISKLEPEDYDFWFFAKDVGDCVEMNRHVLEKWKIQGMGDSTAFIKRLHYDCDDEIRQLSNENKVPPFYFYRLRHQADWQLRKEGTGYVISHPDGRYLQCNSAAALIWEMCVGLASIERIAFRLKVKFPDQAATMIRDVSGAVQQFLACGAISTHPV